MNGGYFARLVQRAAGSSQLNGALPTSRDATPSPEAHEPFEAKASRELEPALTSRVSPAEVATEPHRIEARNAAPAADAPEKPRAEPAPLIWPPVPIQVPAVSINALQPRSVVEKEVESISIESKIREREMIRERLQPPNHEAQVMSGSVPAQAVKKQEREEALPKTEREIRTQIEKIERIPTKGQEPQKLEPQAIAARETISPVAAPAGPRLVIGQMRVEVVPVPQQTSPPVKARPHLRERTRQSEAGAHSGLRFGLGQM
jgi:hypothetical protein